MGIDDIFYFKIIFNLFNLTSTSIGFAWSSLKLSDLDGPNRVESAFKLIK